MPSDVLDSPTAARAVAPVTPEPAYTSFADATSDQELAPARGLAKAIIISLPFWLLVVVAVWVL